MSSALKYRQRGDTFIGIVIGLVLGLFVALILVMYVMKVPMPLAKKSSQSQVGTLEQERQANKSWDPNAPLYGKQANKTTAPAAAKDATQDAIAEAAAAAEAAAEDEQAPVAPTANLGKPATEKTADKGAEQTGAGKAADSKTDKKPEPVDDPLAALVKAKTEQAQNKAAAAPKPPVDIVSANSNADPFVYFVQIGAFVNAEEAESQRAKAGLAGLNASISEREQAGRQVFRVRLGPFEQKDAADRAKARVQDAGLDGVLVRVQR